MELLKRIMLFRGMKIRILGPVIFFFLAGTMVMLTLHYYAMENISQENSTNQANMALDSVYEAIVFPMTVGDDEGVERIIKGIKKHISVFIVDDQGIVTYGPDESSKGEELWGKLPENVAVRGREAIASGSASSIIEIDKKGDTGTLFGMHVLKNEKACFHCHGSSKSVLGAILVKRDVSAIVAAENQSLINIIGIVAALITLAIPILIFILNKTAINPIKDLSSRLKELATGEADLRKQIEVVSVDCSREMDCGKTDCPCYGKESHCWYEAGSYASEIHCPKILTGTYSSCDECHLYKQAIATEVDEVSTFINAFIIRIRDLVARVSNNASNVGREADHVLDEAQNMSEAASLTNRQASELAHSAEMTSDMVNGVIHAMQEMNATVAEIAQNTSQSRSVAIEASEKAEGASMVIGELSNASDKIGEISQLIGSIAEQTNLLALNATIEAARAGEAGKGFAVVANEIKELAKQTGDSVTGINESVTGLKTGVDSAIGAITEIVDVIRQISDMSDTIAVAVEEQTATTSELSANAQSTGETVTQMEAMITEITTASDQSDAGARQVKQSAEELKKLYTRLDELLNEFKV